MIDLNGAEIQTEGAGSAIPEDSIVPFKMTIRQPKAGKEGSTHNLFCKAKSGNEYIDVEFESLSAHGFAGRKVWQNFTLVGSDQAAKISMRTLRAIVESARGIAPSDASPSASAGRQLSDWADFNGMTFLAKVKCVVDQSHKDGNYYVNNEFKKIITPDDSEYSAGECITDKPLPTVPAPGEKPAAPAVAAPVAAWGAPAVAAPVAAWGAPPVSTPTPPPTQTVAPVPAWASR